MRKSIVGLALASVLIVMFGFSLYAQESGEIQKALGENWSLFSEYHKNGEYASAAPYGWNVYRLDPARFKTLYTRLAECYYSFYKRARIGELKPGMTTDEILKTLGEPTGKQDVQYKNSKAVRWNYEAERAALYFVDNKLQGTERQDSYQNPKAYADTMVMIYDLGIKHVPERAASFWLLRGFALENYFDGRELEAIPAYEKSVELDFNGLDLYYIDRLGVLYANNIQSNPEFKSKAIALYRRAQEKYHDNPLPVQRLKALVTDPLEFVTYAEKDLANDPENVEKIWEAAMANREAELWPGAERHLTKLVRKEPKNSTYWNELGKAQQRQQKFRQAIDSYENALKFNSSLKENHLNISDCHRMLGNFTAARASALKGAQADRSWGRPYIVIADIYKAAVERCIMQTKGGDWAKLDIDDKLVYKLAQDYFARAKAIEPAITAEANQRITELSTLVPAKEDLFFYRSRIQNNKMTLQSPCYDWIGESVPVPSL